MALVHTRGWDPALFDTHPWFDALADVLAPFRAQATFPRLEELDRLLAERRQEAELPALHVSFSPPKTTHRKRRKAAIDPTTLYDVRISELGELPTRADDWHDFFNVLSFAAWPRSKHALHTRQSRLLKARLSPAARRLPGARTREQDALTLLDEGGVIVACTAAAHAVLETCTDDLTQPLEAPLRDGSAKLVPFGHALFEHMVAGLACPLAVPQLVMLSDELPSGLRLRQALDLELSRQLRDDTRFLAPSGLKGLPLDRA